MSNQELLDLEAAQLFAAEAAAADQDALNSFRPSLTLLAEFATLTAALSDESNLNTPVSDHPAPTDGVTPDSTLIVVPPRTAESTGLPYVAGLVIGVVLSANGDVEFLKVSWILRLCDFIS